MLDSFKAFVGSSNAQAVSSTAKSVIVGNTAKPNSGGTWDWTFYVKPSDYISDVLVKLHPTFSDPVKRLQGPNFEVSCRGWGTFKIQAEIYWKGGGTLKTSWELQFDAAEEDHHKEVLVPSDVLGRFSLPQPGAAPTAMDVDSTAAVPGQDVSSMVRLGENDRLAILSVLQTAPEMDPGADHNDQSWHGRLVQQELPRPRIHWQSDRRPREDKHGKSDVPQWLNASEYREEPEAMAHKVKILANLLRCSKKTLAYTGAGLSVDAGIEQAATGSAKARRTSPLEADPTVAHCIMAELNRQNLLHGWVQQNHDGLPQKAGYRQEDINEIHGSWYDPSNPVVLYSGSLRSELFQDMRNWAKTSDLVIVLGTSLSGLNADQCVTRTATRALSTADGKVPGSLGSVIISPQRTPEDGTASLRFFATADEVMTALANELNINVPSRSEERRARFSSSLCVKVPYDKNGKRSKTVCTWFDLRPGAQLRLSQFNNIQGAQQPAYLHITPNMIGEALPRNDRACCVSIQFDNETSMQLGLWWLDAALRGGPDWLPVYNVDGIEERQ